MTAPITTADTKSSSHKASSRLAIHNKNSCPQCGGWLLAPDWSEYLSDRCVRHTWSCENCSYQFETAVFFAQAA
jgi:C4-type Zn-finger protein